MITYILNIMSQITLPIAVFTLTYWMTDESGSAINQKGGMCRNIYLIKDPHDSNKLLLETDISYTDINSDSYTIEEYGITGKVDDYRLIGTEQECYRLLSIDNVRYQKNKNSKTFTTDAVLSMVLNSNSKKLQVVYTVVNHNRKDKLCKISIEIPKVYYNEWVAICNLHKKQLLNGPESC